MSTRLRSQPSSRAWATGGLAAAAAWLVAACGARSELTTEASVASATCGNAFVEAGEECDDGNQSDRDGCLGDCRLARCGDGVLAAFEGCDDGNHADGAGCSERCLPSRCGDGVVDPGEECDTAGVSSSCTALCRAHRCGDGVVQQGIEECDDGANNADRFALAVVQGDVRAAVPEAVPGTAVAFYDYESASAHTGYERERESRSLFVLDGAGVLSIDALHREADDSARVWGGAER